MSDAEFGDVEQRLQEIEDRISVASDRCHNRSLIRLAREGRRLARQEHRLIPYLSFSFHLINSADDVLAMKQGCDVAVEMIALLENEERARQFQPDLPQDEYEHTKWWMTGFTYKKLATLTGHTQGYNSDGMHQCISDGMNVCRRTGNRRDTLHFREFAVEVYRAADDLDMALHFARGSLQLQDASDSNRKVASADDAASILSLQGKLDAALEMVQVGWDYCLEFHNPYLAQLNFLPLAREIFCVAGRKDLLQKLPRIVTSEEVTDLADDQVLRLPSEDECPYFKFLSDQTLAVEAACEGKYDRSIQLLQPWDRHLFEEQCLTRWFGVRCRLIAALRLAGRNDQARALAGPCEVAARKSHDWLTLRRLARLLDDSAVVTPLAMVDDPDSGPFSVRGNLSRSVPAPVAEAVTAAPDGSKEPLVTPLGPVIARLYERVHASEESTELLAEIATELVSMAPESISDSEDAGRLLQLARFSTELPLARVVLTWAEEVRRRFSTDAAVISMFATLALRLRDLPDSDLAAELPEDRIERLFRESLELDTDSPNNFARAGLYFLSRGKLGDAERCLARGFRLDRSSAILASSLAQVYAATDRPRDALAVLDMALREGCQDAELAWEAALRAIGLDQFDAALAYLDRLEAQSPDRPWVNHYRAFSLLELERPEEAWLALDREEATNPEFAFPVELQRATAFAQLNRLDEFRQQLCRVLSIPLVSVTYLSVIGLGRLFQRLWLAAEVLPPDDPLRRVLEDYLLATGFATEVFFESLRCRNGLHVAKDIRYFSVHVHQPLDVDWRTARGCLAGQEDWVAYDTAWGVLASDEAAARKQALEWQQRCYPRPANVTRVEVREEVYEDIPGIVWQGEREGRQKQDDEG